jgi:hypothetical protein
MLLDVSTGEILNSNSLMTTFVGTKENDQNALVSVFPNPSGNYANVIFTLKKSEKVKLSVYNSFGEMVYTENAKIYGSGENKIQLHNENLSNGLYIVKLTIGNRTTSQKISIVK